MNIATIPLGTPEKFNVFIEVPAGSSNKYEINEETGFLTLDFAYTDGFHAAFNYGLVPHTQAEDGDHVDAIVLSSYALAPCSVVTVKPMGILKLKDRGEHDNKLITVPLVDPLAQRLDDIHDLSEKEQTDIAGFFREVGVQKKKSIDIEGFFDKAAAMEEIKKCTVE